MNAKTAKKIRKQFRKADSDFIEKFKFFVRGLSLAKRLKIAWWIIWRAF